jgi:hypothetical protein
VSAAGFDVAAVVQQIVVALVKKMVVAPGKIVGAIVIARLAVYADVHLEIELDDKMTEVGAFVVVIIPAVVWMVAALHFSSN